VRDHRKARRAELTSVPTIPAERHCDGRTDGPPSFADGGKLLRGPGVLEGRALDEEEIVKVEMNLLEGGEAANNSRQTARYQDAKVAREPSKGIQGSSTMATEAQSRSRCMFSMSSISCESLVVSCKAAAAAAAART